MTMLEYWELASYIVTVIGLPFALFVFMSDHRKERLNEDEEIYQKLSDEYAEFLKLLLANADLRLLSREPNTNLQLTEEQRERKLIVFEMLISLFERAYILVYEDDMDAQTQRMWSSWDDYIRFWFRLPDFRASLNELLDGEDPDFQKYMRRIAETS